MKRLLKWLAITLGLLGILALVGLFWLGHAFDNQLVPNVDPRLYSQILNARQQTSPKYAHFPNAINPKAEAVAFFHIPGFLQGPDLLCLRLRLPANEIGEILSQLETAKRIEVGNFDGIQVKCYPEYGLKRPPNNNLFEKVGSLPEGFRIFLYQINLEDIKKGDDFFLAFTAVSTERREVIYYAEW